MFDVNSLPTPKVLNELSYENILNQNIANFKILVPDWEPFESDEFKIILEAMSYRELHLRNEFNQSALAFFLSTTTGSDLENYATFYNIERLKGAYPYAEYDFELSESAKQEIVIPKNLVLIDANSKYESKLLEDVIISAGSKKSTGLVELQTAVSTTDVKTEVITTTLPYLVTATAISMFKNGSNPETDAELRERILLSMSDKSTAGSEETYKSYTFSADERIKDVNIINGGPGVVKVFYYSANSDSLMQNRIEQKLNAKDTRPLTDNVIVEECEKINFVVVAELKINGNQETAEIYLAAINNLEKGLESLKKIGVKITLSELNDFLKVPGVKEVIIITPTSNVEVQQNQIGVCSAKTITYTII